MRARRDLVYAQHRWALDRLCQLGGARWVYDNDELGAIRRDVMPILTHHATSRQAAMVPYGKKCCSPAIRGEDCGGSPPSPKPSRHAGIPALRNPSRKRSRSATRAKGRSRRGSLAVRAGIRWSN